MPERKKKTVETSRLTLHQLMLPEHANALGNVHGGTIMRMVDEAGAICAMRHAQRPCVTIAIDSMTFREPVHLGELLICTATVAWVGRSSIEVEVDVHSENAITSKMTHTNSAFVVYIALDENGRPTEVPDIDFMNQDERDRYEEGAERQEQRLARNSRRPQSR